MPGNIYNSEPFDTLQPLTGGSIGIGMYQLASQLARDSEVTVYCRRTAECRTEKVENGVRFVGIWTGADRRIGDGVRRIEHLLRNLLPESGYLYYTWYYFRWYYYLFYTLAIAWRIRKDRPDVVVVTNFSQFVPIIKRLTRRPVILRMHCDWMEELPHRMVERRLKNVEAVVGCCEFVASGIRRRFPEIKNRCSVVYNGSNENTINRNATHAESGREIRRNLGLPEDHKIVLFVGRVVPAKGVHTLVEAMRLVLAREISCSLLVVGRFSGPPSPAWLKNRQSRPLWDEIERLRFGYEEHLARLSEGIEERVRFLGRVPHQELGSYYRLADVFVLPSFNEAFPLVILEAMSCGCPVIATDVGGIPEMLVHGETGLVVGPGDPEALAEAMVDVLKDSARAEEMGNAGLERVAQAFTWASSRDAFLRVLEGALGDGRGA